MNELCNALDNCTRTKDHDGDHGHPVGAGILIAPWPNTGEAAPSEPSSLECLHCGGRTQMQKTEQGGYLMCEGCDEVYTFDAEGYTNYRTTIFPSGDPHKYDDKLKTEFMVYQRAKRQFMAEGQHLFNLIDDDTLEQQNNDLENAIKDWWIEDVKMQPVIRWWQFWR